jgi:hypothetical protein
MSDHFNVGSCLCAKWTSYCRQNASRAVCARHDRTRQSRAVTGEVGQCLEESNTRFYFVRISCISFIVATNTLHAFCSLPSVNLIHRLLEQVWLCLLDNDALTWTWYLLSLSKGVSFWYRRAHLRAQQRLSTAGSICSTAKIYQRAAV